MGRPEAPIPANAPAKALAEFLRDLRRQAGGPGYRELGELVFTRHNALSQTVDGRYVGWARVQKYVAALRAYCRRADRPDVITTEALATLREIHREMVEAARARRTGRRATRLRRVWAQHPELAAGRPPPDSRRPPAR